jgi:hypothetical protein
MRAIRQKSAYFGARLQSIAKAAIVKDYQMPAGKHELAD